MVVPALTKHTSRACTHGVHRERERTAHLEVASSIQVDGEGERSQHFLSADQVLGLFFEGNDLHAKLPNVKLCPRTFSPQFHHVFLRPHSRACDIMGSPV